MSAEDLGGATVHCKTSGVSDYFAQGIVSLSSVPAAGITEL